MTDLPDFLLARFADDARLALGVMSAEDDASAGAAAPYGYGDAAMLSEAEKAHMVRWDPARVLAECQAKRRIVDAYRDECSRRDVYQRDDAMAVEDEKQRTSRRSSAARTRGLEIALEALALPYADHPDYRQEWKP